MTIDPRIERTKRVVLEATADVIGEVGFGRATIESIAERSGVARSTIYRHWPERADLLLEAVSRRVALPEMTSSGDLRTDLLALTSAVAALMTEEDTRWVAGSFIIEAGRDSELAAVHRRFVGGRQEFMASIIRSAIEQGELPPDTDVRSFTEDLAAPIFFRSLVLHETIDPAWLESHVDRWIEHYRSR